MRYRVLVKALLFISLMSLNPILRAAEIRNGQLYLEVLIEVDNKITLKPEKESESTINIYESDLPVCRKMNGKLEIELIKTDKQACWGILTRTEPWTDDSEGIPYESFVWLENHLRLKRENLIYADTSFVSRDSALAYARAQGIPDKMVQYIPIVGSTVKITTARKEKYYLETPLRIHSDFPIIVNSQKEAYSGEFYLKEIDNRLVFTQLINLEEYVAGVIPYEIGGNAPIEAMKAQAITARTHSIALLTFNRHKNDGYDLCNSTHCQVYKGRFLNNPNVQIAVDSTSNQILTVNGRIADTPYHSNCGGHTDAAHQIWISQPLPHLLGVPCVAGVDSLDLTQENQARQWIDTDTLDPMMNSWEKAGMCWSHTISRKKLASNAGMDDIDKIVINQRSVSGRIIDMSFYNSGETRILGEAKIREIFGGLRSSFFYIDGKYNFNRNGKVEIIPGGNLTLKGKGYGHGVGMCQSGALRQAREGKTYWDILNFYYPGTQISTDWMYYEGK